MAGTKSTENEQSRADHEAGHFVAAYSTGILTSPIWVTIEPRGDDGGSTFLRRLEDAPLSSVLHYYLGGIMAEGVGRILRRHSKSPPSEADFREELAHAVPQAFRDGGHGDAARIEALRKKTPSSLWPDIADFRWQTFNLLSEHWERVQLISAALVKHKTLYQSEPSYLVMTYDKPEPLKTHLSKLYLDYRNNKQPIPAPEGWYDGATPEQRKKPFCEGPVEYVRRVYPGALEA